MNNRYRRTIGQSFWRRGSIRSGLTSKFAIRQHIRRSWLLATILIMTLSALVAILISLQITPTQAAVTIPQSPESIPFTVAGFDLARGGQLSFSEGPFFADARAAVNSNFPGVSFLSLNTLATGGLTQADLLILSSGSAGQSAIAPLTNAEQMVLFDYVAAGGCAVLLTDNDIFASNAAAANESLLDPFGLDSAGAIESVVIAPVLNPSLSSLTHGPHGVISAITQGWPGGLTDLGTHAVSLATNPLGDALAIIEPSILGLDSGPVIFYSDVSAFADDTDGGHFSSNSDLMLNTIAYCLDQHQLFIPTIISYQGMLADGGNIANGLYDFRFTLYDASQGGAAVAALFWRTMLWLLMDYLLPSWISVIDTMAVRFG